MITARPGGYDGRARSPERPPVSTTRRRIRRCAALALVAALPLGLAACGDDDVTVEDLEGHLEESGLTQEQATCAADAIFDDLDQGEIADLYAADDAEEAGAEAWEAGTEAIDACVREHPEG